MYNFHCSVKYIPAYQKCYFNLWKFQEYILIIYNIWFHLQFCVVVCEIYIPAYQSIGTSISPRGPYYARCSYPSCATLWTFLFLFCWTTKRDPREGQRGGGKEEPETTKTQAEKGSRGPPRWNTRPTRTDPFPVEFLARIGIRKIYTFS